MVGSSLFVALAALSSIGNILTAAHPGEHHDHDVVKREMEIRHHIAESQKREADACDGSFDVVSRRERAISRRVETVRRLRKERGIDPDCKHLDI